MTDEARAILIICAETRCRPSEVYDLPSDDIRLDAGIPQLWVRNSGAGEDETRQVKASGSRRRVPLALADLPVISRKDPDDRFARMLTARATQSFARAARWQPT